MMNAALAGTDPVIFFESQKVYDIGELFVAEGVPEGYYEIPLSEPSIKRAGSDITIVTLGPALYTAVTAATELEAKYGMSSELVDLRSASPLNYEPVVASVRKTGRVLLVSDAVERGSVMQTVAATLTQLCFDDLDAPPVVLGSRNWITPAAELEAMFFPQPAWLLDAIHERLVPLPGHQPSTDQRLMTLLVGARCSV
jgi:2-oxoisovalerate dehydrogenase E1 component